MSENPPAAQPAKDRTADMAFLDHLEELRWHIIKGLGGIGIGIVIAFIFGDFFVDTVMLGPTNADFIVYDLLGIDAVDLTLQSRKLPGQFFTYWGTLIVLGGIIGSPLLFSPRWSFIEPPPGSTDTWRTRGPTALITCFFMLGVAFGTFALVTFARQFFTQCLRA